MNSPRHLRAGDPFDLRARPHNMASAGQVRATWNLRRCGLRKPLAHTRAPVLRFPGHRQCRDTPVEILRPGETGRDYRLKQVTCCFVGWPVSQYQTDQVHRRHSNRPDIRNTASERGFPGISGHRAETQPIRKLRKVGSFYIYTAL